MTELIKEQDAPLCINCKHFRRDKSFVRLAVLLPIVGWLMAPWLLRESREFAKCAAAPRHRDFDPKRLVDGRGSPELTHCSTERIGFLKEDCGPAGKLFQPRNARGVSPFGFAA